ncbi:hypothetical protein A3H80_02800 [Candidatus Roizmanbacteria bacterium RIFCSPLOWO2_02_FULL_37_19]|uniref:Serine aminopeptidase S33 domain-containing protein n=1 Tax=Candidatus Roizmanbacteria bacterium RIFCSPHIGHO2_02_FULL_37_24 TaxID=1802037 RepID=A0A1F7GUS0_9BACT|nr:MAG: hypothetical protein A3C24_04660 [Candidatus Roizmanbacteria bacterium RIFCSPHIGHO2_02_FULL_37_24]OGK32192.1 MAG: hypothetical protein A3E10_03660 [Candidatus Roizmanbacteria bacterium RIFCSPHIGHO2_12_FULL_37_23]OGK44460.1 MAG: hypothetical protein A2956_01305 [Candidatus Roizmanbacteria bacterium RIFCSPLOWO2_01_FULL_37_57]OGK53789.1 MAG: hypothetical protein A3H80_02800 [Candidatus Roizmanbacteria bacterium RIFCSPLOWO2_02_FULL_37_19]OGK61547.1 MAG: hypothetical protein A3G65_04520 [Can
MHIQTQDGFILDAVYNKVNDSHTAIVFAHGMTVDKENEGIFVRAEDELNNAGYSTFRFDFRAHGASSGNSITDFTISGELQDMRDVMTFLKNEKNERIGLAAASFGGSIAALYTSDNLEKIDALLLANPVMNYRHAFLEPITPWGKQYFSNLPARLEKDGFIKVGSHDFALGKTLFEEMEKYAPCEALKKYSNPLLVMHGTGDTKVPYQDAYDCYEVLPNKHKKFVPIHGSEHGFHEEPHESMVTKLVVDFFKEVFHDLV